MESTQARPETYKTSLKDHYRIGRGYILPLILLIIFSSYILLNSISLIYVLIISMVFIVLYAPGLYIHIKYEEHHKHDILYEYPEHIEIENKGVLKLLIYKKDILKINIYMSPSMVKYNARNGLCTERYNYVEFQTEKGTVIINNLLYPKIKSIAKKLSSNPIIYHKQFSL